jgi:hypothetical protein
MKVISAIKEHPWFGMIKWNELISKVLPAPFVPILDNDSDVSHFAAQFTKCSVNSHNESLDECQSYEGFSFKRSISSPTLEAISKIEEPETETEG